MDLPVPIGRRGVEQLDRMARSWSERGQEQISRREVDQFPAPWVQRFDWRRFELKENLTPGGSPLAYSLVRAPGASGLQREKDEDGNDLTFTVTDYSSRLRARGADDMGEGGTGAYGVAVRVGDPGADDEKWEIWDCEPLAVLCTATLSAALDAEDATATIDHVVPAGDDQSPVNSSDDTLEPTNPGYTGSDGDACVILRVGDAWQLLYMVNPTSVTVVTSVQVDGITLQKKTQSVSVVGAGTESGWTTFHTGDECA